MDNIMKMSKTYKYIQTTWNVSLENPRHSFNDFKLVSVSLLADSFNNTRN